MNLPWLNRVDPDWLAGLARRFPWLFAVDNHYARGGQAEMLLSALAELTGPRPLARRIGVTGLPLGGGNAEVLRAHRLDAEGLAEQVLAAMSPPRP
jgi:transketolase